MARQWIGSVTPSKKAVSTLAFVSWTRHTSHAVQHSDRTDGIDFSDVKTGNSEIIRNTTEGGKIKSERLMRRRKDRPAIRAMST